MFFWVLGTDECFHGVHSLNRTGCHLGDVGGLFGHYYRKTYVCGKRYDDCPLAFRIQGSRMAFGDMDWSWAVSYTHLTLPTTT